MCMCFFFFKQKTAYEVRIGDWSSDVCSSDRPQLIAFASLSMPPKALRQLIQDTARAGGVVVFRGFPNNSLKAFSQALGKIVERQDDFANIGIDPRLFRTFEDKDRTSVV